MQNQTAETELNSGKYVVSEKNADQVMTHDPRWHTVYARAKTPVKNYMAKAWLPWDPILMIRLWTSHGTWSTCGPHIDH